MNWIFPCIELMMSLNYTKRRKKKIKKLGNSLMVMKGMKKLSELLMVMMRIFSLIGMLKRIETLF